MKHAIELPKSSLLAISRFAALKDIRYYLQGICFELGATSSRLIATDGHILGVLRVETGLTPISTPMQFIIPIDAVLRFKPKARSSNTVILHIDTEDVTRASFEDIGTGETFSFALIDGRFPDYRRVTPDSTDGTPAVFNPELLMQFGKAARDLGNKLPLVNIGYNGGSPNLVFIPGQPDFVGVIMPVRDSVIENATLPLWIKS
jgi:DNA polymerase-3 subunit beta